MGLFFNVCVCCRLENERAARQIVESDVAALKALKKDYDLTSAGLMQEYDILVKDHGILQSTHQQVRQGRGWRGKH